LREIWAGGIWRWKGVKVRWGEERGEGHGVGVEGRGRREGGKKGEVAIGGKVRVGGRGV